MADVTELRHYTNFPVCGYCMNAWNIIYGRMRTGLSPEKWLGYCRWGGCDPDVWDHIDDRTGWPWGWKVNKETGWPRCYTDPKAPMPLPDTDNRVYHMRANDDPAAPWRKTSDRLRAARQTRNGKIKGINLDEIEWDEEEITDEDVFGPNGDEAMDAKMDAGEVDLDDEDLW